MQTRGGSCDQAGSKTTVPPQPCWRRLWGMPMSSRKNALKFCEKLTGKEENKGKKEVIVATWLLQHVATYGYNAEYKRWCNVATLQRRFLNGLLQPL